MELFNICSADRKIREVVAAEPTILGLKRAAFQLMQKPIIALVMETSGFKVSNDQVLKIIKNKIIMVLTLNEMWTAEGTEKHLVDNLKNQQQIKGEADISAEQTNDTQLVDVIVPDEEFDEIADESENESILNNPELKTQSLSTNVHNSIKEYQDLVKVTPTPAKEIQLRERIDVESHGITTNKNDLKIKTPSSNALAIATQTSNIASPHLGEVTLSSSMEIQPDIQEQTINENESASLLNPPESQQINAGGQQHEQQPCTSAKSPKRLQPQLVKVAKKRGSITMKFESFEIDWKKLEDDVYERLDNADSKTIVAKQDRIKVVNMVIGQLRLIDDQVSASVIETSAKKIVEKFPCFQPRDDDDCQDENRGWSTLKTCMVNRNSFLNRPQDMNKKPPSSKESKHLRNVRAGTLASYWKESNSSCDKSTQSKLKRDDVNVLTEEFLESSAGFVRSILDTKKTLVEIVNEWPVVRRRKIIEFHFMKATGVNLHNLSKYFNTKRPKIIQLAQQKDEHNNLNENSSDYEVFTFICKYLKENISDICVIKELGTKLSEITLSPGPGLIAVDLGSAQNAYYVFAESARLSEGASTFLIALQDLFGVLFINNFMYPKENSKLLEFIQQYFLKIIPVYGTKSKATRVGKQQRVVNRLINDLSNINVIAEQ